MKAENIYLRIAFDFTDKQGNPIGENFTYNTALAIPLNVDSKELSHKESLIVNSDIADMIVELIQSGQINHLCPQIQDTNPKIAFIFSCKNRIFKDENLLYSLFFFLINAFSKSHL